MYANVFKWYLFMQKNVYFVDFDTAAREMSDSTVFTRTKLEDFIADQDVVSHLRQFPIHTMENLSHFFHRHTKQWFISECKWTYYEFRVIEQAVQDFDKRATG